MYMAYQNDQYNDFMKAMAYLLRTVLIILGLPCTKNNTFSMPVLWFHYRSMDSNCKTILRY